MINNWLKIFVYHLKDNKLFSALNVLGLSLGIAGLIFSILYWNDEQSYNAWNPEKEKVYQSLNNWGKGEVFSANIPDFNLYFQKSFPEIESFCYFERYYIEENIRYKFQKEMVKIIDAQKTFFEFFPFTFIKGNAKTALQDENSIAISKEVATNLFGDENPLGKEIAYRDKRMIVRGVYFIPGKSSLAPTAVTNCFIANSLKNDGEGFSHGLMIKLKNSSDVEIIINRMEKIIYDTKIVKWAKAEGISPNEYLKKLGIEKLGIVLEPLSTTRLHSQGDSFAEGKGNYQFLLIMLGLSILILILSIFNYVNLATADAIKRAKEVGVRKIIGATRADIVKQFVFETAIIALFSILLALVIVELSLPYYNDFLDKNLMMNGSEFYLQLVCIFVITVIVAGIFPAFYVSNFETLKVLKGNFGRSKSGIWLRNGMLVLQFAIASFFIIGSYIVYQQIHLIANKSLGFSGEQVISVYYNQNNIYNNEPGIETKIFNRYETIKSELSKIKGVESVSTGAYRFGGNGNSISNLKYKNEIVQAESMATDFGMLELMKIKIVKGRGLNENFASDTINSVLINETTLKKLNEKNPIGKEFDWEDKRLRIIGIVKDFNFYNLQLEIPTMVLYHFKINPSRAKTIRFIYIRLKQDDIENTIADIEKFWTTKVNTEYPFKFDFVDKAYARTYENYVKQKNMFSLLNIVVIIIALFGLFALASYTIQRRMKEIAIRKTFGAETNVLLTELSKQYIIFCLIGFLLALFPVYYFLTMWLENFAYRIEISVVPFIVGFVCLLSLTLVVVLSRAYQATRIDVIKYLKYE